MQDLNRDRDNQVRRLVPKQRRPSDLLRMEALAAHLPPPSAGVVRDPFESAPPPQQPQQHSKPNAAPPPYPGTAPEQRQLSFSHESATGVQPLRAQAQVNPYLYRTADPPAAVMQQHQPRPRSFLLSSASFEAGAIAGGHNGKGSSAWQPSRRSPTLLPANSVYHGGGAMQPVHDGDVALDASARMINSDGSTRVLVASRQARRGPPPQHAQGASTEAARDATLIGAKPALSHWNDAATAPPALASSVVGRTHATDLPQMAERMRCAVAPDELDALLQKFANISPRQRRGRANATDAVEELHERRNGQQVHATRPAQRGDPRSTFASSADRWNVASSSNVVRIPQRSYTPTSPARIVEIETETVGYGPAVVRSNGGAEGRPPARAMAEAATLPSRSVSVEPPASNAPSRPRLDDDDDAAFLS
jgi:hypothetical protein